MAIHQAVDQDGRGHPVSFSYVPNICPVCNVKVSPEQQGLYFNNKAETNSLNNELEIVYRCSNMDCRGLFIAYYKTTDKSPNSIGFIYQFSKPKCFKKIIFSEIINKISPNFNIIYNESAQAEELGLINICGVGYRKSVEFLIKDYLLRNTKDKDDKKKIKSEFLSTCIKNRVSNSNIQNVSDRAVWLGNDEAHYSRIWKSQDLQDLKKLIDLTIHWIEGEHLTAQFLKKMPRKKNV